MISLTTGGLLNKAMEVIARIVNNEMLRGAIGMMAGMSGDEKIVGYAKAVTDFLESLVPLVSNLTGQ